MLYAYGAMVERADEAAAVLDAQGVSVTVVNARFAKPLDVETLRTLAKGHRVLLTLEEHTLMGGFGSAVTEAFVDERIPFERIVRLGIPDAFQTFGSRDQLLKNHGLDVEGIVKKVRELIPHGGTRVEPRTLKAATSLKS